MIVLTTNRPDLVDEAIRDRFLVYRVDYPDADNLSEIAIAIAKRHSYSPAQQDMLKEIVRDSVAQGKTRSIRDIRRLLLRHHLEQIVREKSLSEEYPSAVD